MKISKKILIVAIVAVLLGGGVFTYTKLRSGPPSNTSGLENVNLNPPTESDRIAAEEHKKAIDESTKNKNPTNSSGQVVPLITYAEQYQGNVEVGGYVPGIFEEGGMCTATFMNSSTKLTSSVSASRNSSSVDCPTMSKPATEFKTGTWDVTITYSSAKYSGTSQPKTIEVR